MPKPKNNNIPLLIVGKDVEFAAKISKQGTDYFLHIPTTLNTQAEKLRGKLLEVVVKEIKLGSQK